MIPNWPLNDDRLPATEGTRIAKRLSPRFHNRFSVLGVRIAIVGALLMTLGGVELWRKDQVVLCVFLTLVGVLAIAFAATCYLTTEAQERRRKFVAAMWAQVACVGVLCIMLGFQSLSDSCDRDAQKVTTYGVWGLTTVVGLIMFAFGVEIWCRAPINNSVENEIAGAGSRFNGASLPLWLRRAVDELRDATYGGWLGAIAWNMITDALVKSKNALEREHLYLGKFADRNIPIVRYVPCSSFGFPIVTDTGNKQVPVLLHIPLLYLGCLITGAIGSGKTMMALLSIVLQLHKRKEFRTIIVDLKGDNNFFKACMQCMADYYSEFFFLNREAATRVWNPFAESIFKPLPAAEKAQVLSHGLGAYFGDQYGATFFLGQIELIIQAAFEWRPNIGSFRELLATILSKKFYKRGKVTFRQIENAGQLVAALRQLAAIEQINVTNGKPFEHRLDLGASLLEWGITYFSLPVSINPMAAKTLSRIVSLLVSIGARKRGNEGPRTFLCVDECQEWITHATIPILRMSRDSRLHLVLSLQNTSDLETPAGNFINVVTGNTAVKITCTALDLAARLRLREVGGEMIEELHSTSRSTSAKGEESSSTQSRETKVPVWGPNKVNALNAITGHALLESSPHSGFTVLNGPQLIDMPYPLTLDYFEHINARAMPEARGDIIVRGIDLKAPLSPQVEEEDEEEDDAQGAPVPVPPTPPPVPNGAEKKPRRRRGKLTPEEEALAKADAELLRKLAGM